MLNFLLGMDLGEKRQDKELQFLLFFTGIKEEKTGLAKGGCGEGSNFCF